MKNKINSFLGRNLLKTSKFKPLLSLAISRIAVLKNQRQVRSSQAKSDVLQLLQLGNHDRALLRVEQVIKEQNMLDVYDMVEAYCNLLIERLHLIERQRECPDELREAISGLLYAASRCGDFPELHEIRAVLTSHFGKEFVGRAVELRNNCGVNHTIIVKLSTRQPSLEKRMATLKEIASEHSIVLQLDEASSFSTQENTDLKNQTQSSGSGLTEAEDNENDDERFSGSVKTRKKYKDVADAAQAAFESAAYAAAAARAAVELSRSGHDSDAQDSPGKSVHGNRLAKTNSKSEEKAKSEHQNSGLKRSASSSTSDSITQTDAKDVAFHDGSDGDSSGLEADQTVDSVRQYSPEHDPAETGIETTMRINLDKAPFSMRTRRLRGF